MRLRASCSIERDLLQKPLHILRWRGAPNPDQALLPQQEQQQESVMSALLNIIYREYFRARLAEMRQPAPLQLPATAPSDDSRPN